MDGVETGDVGGAAGAAAAAGAPAAGVVGAAAGVAGGGGVVAVCARAGTAQRETAPMHIARTIIFVWVITDLVICGRFLLGGGVLRPAHSHPKLGVGRLYV